MLQWKDRKILVLGLGDSGLSMIRWLVREGAQLSVADSRPAPPHAETLSAELPDVPLSGGAFRDSDFAHADAIAISPGVDRREPLVAAALRRGVPVVGDVEIFAQAVARISAARSKPRPRVVAITGSNGKSTVTVMTGEALRAAGRATIVAGNIGPPVLDALREIEDGAPLPDVFVLELSSFQLESTYSLDADVASVLNVTEDHLDRYDGMADYAASKARIFQGNGAQVLNRGDPLSMNMIEPDRRVATFGLDAPGADHEWGITAQGMLKHGAEDLIAAQELPLTGLHNAANALASLALGDAIGISARAMLEGIARFQGLPHRLQKIRVVRGIAFFDDSKGTNVGATVAALSGMTCPVTLIAGGDGKSQDFSPLAAAVSAHARTVVLIGRDADRIERAISTSRVPVLHAKTLADAVEAAYRASAVGDAVLLSPACASYDMFRSYVHRGEVFAQAVEALAAREGAPAQ